jgi:hypothetical protein
MLKKALVIFGIVYILLAILGIGMLLAGNHTDGHHMLLGVFRLDVMHDLVHMLSGVVALATAVFGTYAHARLYFQVFGVIYALVAVVGFVQGHTVLGLFVINMADNYLHVAIALASLALGFLTKKTMGGATPSTPPAVK